MSAGKPEKVNEISAFGILACCVGVIWTLLVYMSLAAGLNELQSKIKIFGFAIIIPIWGWLDVLNTAKAINLVIEEKGLKVEPANEMVFLLITIFVAPVGFFLIFKKYNEVIDALG